MITKKDILKATHKGFYIFQRVLSYYYEDTLALGLSGKKCLPAQNPFNGGKRTLRIFLHEDEFCFEDDSLPGFIGNSLDFASFHYKLSGDLLLEKINEELKLKLGEGEKEGRGEDERVGKGEGEKMRNGEDERVGRGEGERGRKGEDERVGRGEGERGQLLSSIIVLQMPCFSFYRRPITNTQPEKQVTLLETFQMIKSDQYKERTLKLRSIADPDAASLYKKNHFDSVTFSGVFSSRKNSAIVQHSGLLTLDFDHVDDLPRAKNALVRDPDLLVDMLFDSPSGHGFKCIISIDVMKHSHQKWFESASIYLKHRYNLQVDPSGKDVSRACFLPWDPKVWIHPIYLI